MAVQKAAAETGIAGRHAGRPGQSQAADQAGLAALTTTLLAGAVTGAVAGVVEAREAMARDEPAREPAASPDDAASLPGQGATADAAAQAAQPGDAAPPASPHEHDSARAGGEQIDHAVATNERSGVSQAPTADTDSEATQAAVSTLIPTTAAAGATIATLPGEAAEAAHGDEAAMAADVASPLLQAIVGSGGPGAAAGLADTVTSAIDQALARLDADLGRISEGLAARPQEVVTSLQGTIDETVSALAAEATGHLETLSATVDDSLSATVETLQDATDALPAALAIPATLLGADAEDKQPDGLLSRLFDKGENAAQTVPSANAGEPGEAAFGGADAASGLAAPAGDFAMPDLAGGIEAVRIGFAGQSYADAPDAHDGPAGAHGNLLHGLL
jgi:Arc/MetJ family transcription regulator